ncbi:catalase/peroxidase HPI [Shewanella woodyi]|uniref:Catalase-peroxidase n=1 Tax=Shewanella woodyi (strain ATCC 51908 / MS32) TaxID=392500 RepID=KATG_SHEWM|nr:catalase/peroxidase HPI [Shewanella woodyi]B1KFI8.1 RecName: Full=Catalase-peroxidase; Short=CP; AltName: Full=Peroxidase/catalase; Flags: Precursor [Shewanella woodyi ATCC 51908]ACA88163.1 catalase/peroxidase HPI [Shewanella woodyi ATCC 51908]
MFKKTILSFVISAVMVTAASAVENEQPKSNQFWWPNQLDLTPLRNHSDESNPQNSNFDYAEAFEKLDLEAVKKDIDKVLTNSQDWWPADYGHYGPFFIRMAWHAAGTYRTHDGRGGAGGGQQRFDPLNSWPDNVNLDKARRLLWPIKQKYGQSISWADLIALTGNVALESMGFKTYGYAGGREDDWEPDLVYWGPESKFLTDERRDKKGKLKGPLAAVEMGLIYVNPVGPHGNPDPLLAANDIRMSFGRMAMNDEEIVALIAGGHTFGKAHGAKKPTECVGPEPAAAAVEEQGFGWKNRCGTGSGADTTSSGLEGAWTITPTQWTTNYLDNLFTFNWVKTKSPAGAIQWIPDTDTAANLVPDAHDPTKRHAPIMFTTDIAIKEDPKFRAIAESFRKSPDKYELAFAKAWFKLNHRDLGPRSRYLGNEVPKEVLVWQDPIPELNHPVVNDADIAKLKSEILKSGLSVQDLVLTAWASASSYRGTDMRGGANGARINLSPQNEWQVNNPKQLAKVLNKLEKIKDKFNKKSKKAKISLADLIVLGGAAAIEKSVKEAGFNNKVPFTPGRMDASQAMTDVASFGVLESTADGFRNYYSDESNLSPAQMLIDKADLLTLTVPEMTALVGGMRALSANADGSNHGVFTDQPGVLSNDFFVNLLDMSVKWSKKPKSEALYEGYDRKTGKLKWTATPVDLVFGSNTELRAISEFYASKNAEEQFITDFIAAWHKVMVNDRFDIK